MGIEVEERGGAARGQAGELNERLVGVDVGLRAPERVGAESGDRQALALPGSGGQERAAAVGDVDPQEGSQGSVIGLGPRIEVDPHQAQISGQVAATAGADFAGLI